MTTARSTPLARGRLASSLNSLVVVVVAALVASFALAARPSSPPSVAEFAPQAAQQIDEAPEELAGTTGGGVAVGPESEEPADGEDSDGDGLGADASEGEGSGQGTGKPVGVPSSLACVTWPDGSVTQTFDPQSPPCVASWPDAADGNGGATARGVTETEIRVAVRYFSADAWEALADFFNTHYQLYGRRITIVHAGFGAHSDPAGQAAQAQETADLGVFASLDYNYYYTQDEFADQVTDLGVMYIRAAVTGNYERNTLAVAKPGLLWTYFPDYELRARETGRFVCAALAGRPPQFGGPGIGEPGGDRRFAVLYPEFPDGRASPDLAPLTAELDRCGAPYVTRAYPESMRFNFGADTPEGPQIMAQLRAEGVTSILPVTGANAEWFGLWHSADRVQFQPEWVLNGRLPGLTDNWRSFVPPSQMAHVFGPTEEPRTVPIGATPAAQALAEVGIDAQRQDLIFFEESGYGAMQLLAAGIQQAGPELTVDTFRAGLQATRFSNPGVQAPPYFQQGISFSPSDYSEVDDFAIRWWSATGTDVQDGASGTWCWWDGGARYAGAGWPADFSFRPGAPCP